MSNTDIVRLTCNKKITVLPSSIHTFPSFEVACVDCYVPPQILTQAQPLKITVLRQQEEAELDSTLMVEEHLTLDLSYPLHNFDVVRELVKQIGGYGQAEIDSNSGKLNITLQENVTLIFSNILTKVLGLKSSAVSGQANAMSRIVPEFLYGKVVLATDLTRPHFLNGRYLSCIYSGACNQRQVTPTFYPVCRCQVSTILLEFYNMFGEEMSVPDETYSVELLLRPTS